jgi:hypothetical protein
MVSCRRVGYDMSKKNWMDDLVSASPAARHVAYAGEIEFAGCTEDDRTGRTVSFLLRRPVEDLSTAHPFSAHTRRRRGHAGTQFEAALQLLHGAGPGGMHSMMLLNWGAGPKGEIAKFLLTFDQEKHPFLVCQRAAKDQAPTRWMAAFVEIDETSQAVDQKQRAAVETALAPRKPKQQIRNSNLAAQFIKNPVFWQFIEQTYGEHVSDALEADGWLKLELKISSKAELDSGPMMNEMFDALRTEFVDWQLETFGPDALI